MNRFPLRLPLLLAAALLTACGAPRTAPLEERIEAVAAALDARVGVAILPPEGGRYTERET